MRKRTIVLDPRDLKLKLGCMLLLSVFLLTCIHQKLAGDMATGNWQSMVTRILLVVMFSFFLTWRLGSYWLPLLFYSFKNFRNFLIVLFFLGVLFFPITSHFSDFARSVDHVARSIIKDEKGIGDKMIALLRQFPSKYSEKRQEHFQLPKLFVHFNALVKIHLLGVSPNSNVAVGKNGFYFEGWGARKVEKGIVENFDNIADYMGQLPFSVDQLRQWKRTLEERRYWLKAQGADYVFVLAPTKALIYPEYLPSNLQMVEKGLMRYDQLTEFLHRQANIIFIDLRPSLLAAKKEQSYPLLFYKTDFHWNYYGAFIAYQTMIKKLRQEFPQYNLEIPQLSDFDLVINKNAVHHRFMDMIGLPITLHRNMHYITMVPKSGGRYDSALDLPPKGIYDVYPPKRPVKGPDGTSMDLRLLLNPEAPIDSLLLLGDSFLEKCVYFFSADAKRVINQRTVVNFPADILRYEKPDIVIQEILNMFILRSPPENPPDFKNSYLPGKFAENGQNKIARLEGDYLSRIYDNKRGVYTIEVPLGYRESPFEVRVGRLVFKGSVPKDLAVHISLEDGKKMQLDKRNFSRTGETFYFALPAEAIKALTISTHNLSTPLTEFEVRSDR